MSYKKRLALRLGIAMLLMMATSSVAIACGSAAAAEVPLQNSYEAGDSWAYEMTVVVNGSVEGFDTTDSSDTAIPKDTTAKIRVSADVEDVTDGVATIAFSYETLELSAEGQPLDTAGQGAQEITVKVDRTGKVLSVEGLEEGGVASDVLGSQLPFDPTEFTNQFSVAFPENGEAKVGDEWSASSTFPFPGTGQDLTATTKAKLTAVATENGRQMATIDYTVTMPMDLTLDLGALLQQVGENAGGGDLGDAAFKMTMSGGMDFEGTAKVNTTDGRAVSTDGVATIKIEMAVSEAPEEMVPQNERGPFTIDMNISITMEETE